VATQGLLRKEDTSRALADEAHKAKVEIAVSILIELALGTVL
jgi:hypothetical protein